MISGAVRLKAQQGSISLWEPWIDVEVAGTEMDFITVPAVVDTGFTGWLALPEAVIRDLALTRHGERTVNLAHGQRGLPIFGAIVSWFGELRAVPIHQIDGDPLVGTALLTNCLLSVDFREGGVVNIRPHRLNPQK